MTDTLIIGRQAARALRGVFARMVGCPVIRAVPFPDGATIQLGRQMKRPDGSSRGEWYLWLRYVDWRLERGSSVICGSADEPSDEGRDAFASLLRKPLTAATISESSPHDIVLRFGKLRLKTFAAVSSEEDDLSRLTTPDNQRFILTVDGTLRVSSST